MALLKVISAKGNVVGEEEVDLVDFLAGTFFSDCSCLAFGSRYGLEVFDSTPSWLGELLFPLKQDLNQKLQKTSLT